MRTVFARKMVDVMVHSGLVSVREERVVGSDPAVIRVLLSCGGGWNRSVAGCALSPLLLRTRGPGTRGALGNLGFQQLTGRLESPDPGSKAARLFWEGRAKPLSLRTNWRADAWTSLRGRRLKVRSRAPLGVPAAGPLHPT
jgi:hypothetical protein